MSSYYFEIISQLLKTRTYAILSLLILFNAFNASGQEMKGISWEEIKSTKKGTLPVYWFESRPFIFKNDDGSLGGIEYDLVNSFAGFVKKQYQIDLKVEWIRTTGFTDVMDIVTESSTPCFGVSAYSKTEERKLKVDYSPTYMSDIIVLISNKSVPITESAEEFKNVFSNLTAITILGTTYEMELLMLKQNQNMPFKIEYILSDENILEQVGSREDTFGFIDLPIYLLYYSNDPSINARRQNFYPIKREGYGFLLQKNSDWMEPVNAFFDQPKHPQELESIIGKYLDLELYHLNERLALQSNSHEELLAKEKEIQYQDLLDKSKEIEARTRTNYILASLVIIAIIFSAVIVFQYVKRNQQKIKIEAQQVRIELANRQLEQRNQHLIALDEEKNNLIKILAHDMRQPLSQIEGLSLLLAGENLKLEQERKDAIQNIIDAAQRLSRMIINILDVDAIENKRIEFVAEKVEVSTLLTKVADSFKAAALRKNITIQQNVETNNLMVHADPLYLTQVIENLVSNAIKFSPPNTTVTLNSEAVGGRVQVGISDEGPGIAEEDKDKLFMKFQKLSARPTGGEASIGLGLAIVKKYVELMDGKVWFEPNPNKGAKFILEFNRVV